MTNNRKPVDEVRLSLSAARKREAGTHLYERLADKDMRDKHYTPPPNVAAWLQAQADKPKAGRDIESLMRYHEAHKKGVTDDDALRAKYGAVTCAKCGMASVGVHYCTTGQPTPTPVASASPQSADGGRPLPSASTKPRGKDVDTPWPKCVNWFGVAVYVFAGPARAQGVYHRDNGTSDSAAGDYDDRLRNGGVPMPNPEAAQWLEQNGHKDAAAQLRGKVATGGGRVWKGLHGSVPGFMLVNMGEAWFARNSIFGPPWLSVGKDTDPRRMNLEELFGPEKDAILAECRKAMGLK